MKKQKEMTLGEQVRDARKVMATWSEEKRASVQLEGCGINFHKHNKKNYASKIHQ